MTERDLLMGWLLFVRDMPGSVELPFITAKELCELYQRTRKFLRLDDDLKPIRPSSIDINEIAKSLDVRDTTVAPLDLRKNLSFGEVPDGGRPPETTLL